MILTDREIKIAVEKQQITTDPVPREEAFSSTAVDLTLDPRARLFSAPGELSLDPASPDYRYHAIADRLTDEVSTDPGFDLAHGRLLLAWTREYIALPEASRIAARVEGKSSLARLGLGIHITAPTIHAGFKGQLQLEVVNHGPA